MRTGPLSTSLVETGTVYHRSCTWQPHSLPSPGLLQSPYCECKEAISCAEMGIAAAQKARLAMTRAGCLGLSRDSAIVLPPSPELPHLGTRILRLVYRAPVIEFRRFLRFNIGVIGIIGMIGTARTRVGDWGLEIGD